ncbi:transglutaminase domain-containing protein [Paenibacillus sp. IB182496]|uniref:Transglutaminase domain-containing protein n=1 Tax=Paenibacillus sabuli TaxID=2772509 RepID=A0A927BRZ3_9BACL|nr:transglutaminase-like domain-containing protein [Paenibacillus sabuli]MBD2845683.1 transglutaminase domain-containing protein [Paenibacillus sabuli]
MAEWGNALTAVEPVALVVLLLLAVSLVLGFWRGASGSARRLLHFLADTLAAVVALLAAARIAVWLSPLVRQWLVNREIAPPEQELSALERAWHTLVTGLRDFELLRFGALMLVFYVAIRLFLGLFTRLLPPLDPIQSAAGSEARGRAAQVRTLAGRAAGALLGLLHGACRALIIMAVLFVYVSLAPGGPLAPEIRSSPLYRQASTTLLEPLAGGMIADRGPVLAEAVQSEFRQVLDRRYELIDYAIPEEVDAAAAQITAGLETEEAKARALYDWIGTRIAYDWDKADAYEERGEWREQTPQQTFDTRTGVCIDVARLYAVMARSAELEVRVVTGMGADGRGGYGPHAWNEVYLPDEQRWAPLDATWAESGDWFDSPEFERTHIRET